MGMGWQSQKRFDKKLRKRKRRKTVKKRVKDKKDKNA